MPHDVTHVPQLLVVDIVGEYDGASAGNRFEYRARAGLGDREVCGAEEFFHIIDKGECPYAGQYRLACQELHLLRKHRVPAADDRYVAGNPEADAFGHDFTRAREPVPAARDEQQGDARRKTQPCFADAARNARVQLAVFLCEQERYNPYSVGSHALRNGLLAELLGIDEEVCPRGAEPCARRSERICADGRQADVSSRRTDGFCEERRGGKMEADDVRYLLFLQLPFQIARHEGREQVGEDAQDAFVLADIVYEGECPALVVAGYSVAFLENEIQQAVPFPEAVQQRDVQLRVCVMQQLLEREGLRQMPVA